MGSGVSKPLKKQSRRFKRTGSLAKATANAGEDVIVSSPTHVLDSKVHPDNSIPLPTSQDAGEGHNLDSLVPDPRVQSVQPSSRTAASDGTIRASESSQGHTMDSVPPFEPRTPEQSSGDMRQQFERLAGYTDGPKQQQTLTGDWI